MSTSGEADLAQAIVERRAELGWSQKDLIERSGVSKNVIQAMEGAEERSYRPANKRAVEDALGWEHGSIDALLTQSGPPRLARDSSVVEHLSELDPERNYYTLLGIKADEISRDAGERRIGAGYIVGVLRKQGLVDNLQDSVDHGSSHAS